MRYFTAEIDGARFDSANRDVESAACDVARQWAEANGMAVHEDDAGEDAYAFHGQRFQLFLVEEGNARTAGWFRTRAVATDLIEAHRDTACACGKGRSA